MISFLDSVRQEESFRIDSAFSRVPVAVNHGMHGSQLNRSDSAPPSFSFSNKSQLCSGANDNQSSQHKLNKIKFLSAEERFLFGIGMALVTSQSLSLHHSERTATQRLVGGSGSQVSENKRERTET